MSEWKTQKLGEVCKIEKKKYNGSNLAYVGMEDIESNTGRFLGSKIPKSVKSSTFKFTSEHILYGRLRPYLNKVMLPDFEGHCSSEIFPIKVSKELDRSFLFYWLTQKKIILKIDETCTGTRMPRANMEKVLNFSLVIPPIEEQKRIVEILDKAFEGIAQAEANTRRNLINARELFDSYLNQIFTNQHKNWVTNTLDEICIKITDGKHGDCKNQDHSGYYFLSAKDVKNDRLNYDNARQITKEDFDETNRRTNLEPFDILVTNSGTIGRTAIAPDDPKTYRTTFQKSVAILKPKKEIIDSNFCRFELMANLNKIIAISSGTAQKNLLLRDIRSFHFSMPSNMKEQKKIVSQLTKVLDNSQKLETIYQRKLEAIAELKQSILEKAFTGQLSQ